jgi:5-carboxymethyl-2-hydroxymuconate isomerase
MVLVEDTGDLQTDKVRAISDKAMDTLMDSGYLPAATVRRVQDWLDEYRAASADGAH